MIDKEMDSVDLREVAQSQVWFWALGVVVFVLFGTLFYIAEAPGWLVAVICALAGICAGNSVKWKRRLNSWE